MDTSRRRDYLRRTVFGGALLLYLAVSVFCILVLSRRTLSGGALLLLSATLVLLAYVKMVPHRPPALPAPVAPTSVVIAPTQPPPQPTTSAAIVPEPPPHPVYLPHLSQDTTAYYAPDKEGEPFGMLPPGTVYTLAGRYGWEWLQADVDGHGRLWMPATSLASADVHVPALPAILDRFAAIGIEVHPLSNVLGE
jgi:hypothetical protein